MSERGGGSGGIEVEVHGACRSLSACVWRGATGLRLVTGFQPCLAIKIQGTSRATHGSSLEISAIPLPRSFI